MSMTGSAEKPKRLTRAERRAMTREALVAAASRVIAERGLHGASIEAIVAEAGFTGGAFYANFDSKEELFTEVLEQRVFKAWRQILAEAAGPSGIPTARQVGEVSAAMNSHPDAGWIIQHWLELMANARRDERFRRIAAGLWRDSRELSTTLVTAAFEAAGREPPAPVEHLVIAMNALETGLALQHYTDPDAVPADLIPEIFDLVFGPLQPR